MGIEPQQEQRATRRFALRLPLTVKFPDGGEKEAQTRDVSARGISFYVDSPSAKERRSSSRLPYLRRSL